MTTAMFPHLFRFWIGSYTGMMSQSPYHLNYMIHTFFSAKPDHVAAWFSPGRAKRAGGGSSRRQQCRNPVHHADYVDGFKLTEREFELLSRELPVESRRFIVKQGHNSVVAELNLRGFDDELEILSGRTASVELAEAIRKEVGDRLEDWLPVFQQRRRTD